MTYVLVPSTSELPDVFTELIQRLPGAKICPVSGNLAQQIIDCEKFLDKHELRSDVVFITRGTGAFVAQALKEKHPNRIEAILAIGYPHRLAKLPRLLFREKSLIPTGVAVTEIPDEQALLRLL